MNIQVSCYESTDGGTDDNYEPFGYLKISIGQREKNQKRLVWDVEADSIQVPLKSYYRGPTKSIEFYEDFDFLTAKNKYSFTLYGHVFEYDWSYNDVLGNFENHNEYVDDYVNEAREIQFDGEEGSEKAIVKMKFYK